ncbi:cytosolic sulfotransferase 12-like protein [Cinnamomum micranthum f. kanehirae]|uniref:Sulfotransferase n=2 Tax=Cinnamomum micranthum f. kanehirae TaxID=337451 RepID=A0A443N4K0_9MAGN|nr:cytosolic sulfotransferase 12-like protein [Cinnamomum micranthum f. kanehirae]
MATSNIVPEHEVPLSIVEKEWKSLHLTQYQGFWRPLKFLSGVMAYRECFEACKDDIILNTTPKSGTTWMKALTFTILSRTRRGGPTLSTAPGFKSWRKKERIENHVGGPNSVHNQAYEKCQNLLNQEQHIETIIVKQSSQARTDYRIRLKATLASIRFLLCQGLPFRGHDESEDSNNMVQLPHHLSVPDPKDAFVSLWYFLNNFLSEDEPPVPIEEAFELFHGGISIFGPFWKHLLGYWRASLERPERVLFMKYEELKEDPTFHLRRLAEFLGFPFSIEEERQGLVEKIERFCSFESLMSLEVNKSGKTRRGNPNKNFFRRGIVGDWKNHLTAEMSEKLDQLNQQKLEAFGLTFKDVGK